jgi:hypothetical protein
MKVCYTLFITLLLFTTALPAQMVQLKDATRQSWAGGVCCAHGINYVIQLNVASDAGSAGRFRVDTLWIKGVDHPFIQPEVQLTFTGDSSKFTGVIHAGQTFDNRRMLLVQEELKEKAEAPPAPHFEGEALVVYHFRGKQRRLEIAAFQELVPLAFP